ncbi:RadC family protein [Agarivorans sp. MS3-6]|uniref:RadC family protein n=1 Tax=Agarivorans sp. TSD2052 TaxID=2937286 RepID=UPI002010265D|nr:DNA repair protein RadC [Agarivorans sp. TSD2052]UPW18566.1 DNA repair protein RadC [Agarivorans sp. TSD2052]
MSISDWPADQRPREKLLSKGAHSLSDAELLAIFLRIGCAGMDAVSLAQHLLQHFGSLRAVLSADQQTFCAERGMGCAKFAQLQASIEMSRRYLLADISEKSVVDSAESAKNYLSMELSHQQREVFAILLLDNQHRVLQFAPLFFGTIDAASVYPRVVVQRVLEKNAAAVIFAHNHPSGVAEPSQADKQITTKLIKALALIDVRVLDHIVIGYGETMSFAERGWI